jgi:DNA-binding GntR family transcriptional regulator
VLVAIADRDPAAASEAMRVLVELALEDTRQAMEP